MISKRKLLSQPDYSLVQPLLELGQSHVHRLDMPFRLTSSWQEQGCEFGIWEQNADLVAWAVFQPAWATLDYALSPHHKPLLKEIIAWGKKQMQVFANRKAKAVTGYIEVFEDAPLLSETVDMFKAGGYELSGEATLRFSLDLQQSFPAPRVAAGTTLRPLALGEIDAYQQLVNDVFAPSWMTADWRKRIFTHARYRQALDLVAENAEGDLIGFCGGWLWKRAGQLEPLGVHPDYRGLGLGQALELAMVEAMQRQGARTLTVDHGEANEGAVRLSRKVGFRQQQTILRYTAKSG